MYDAVAAMATILIIDDNDTIREGLAHTVKKLGHEAVAAASGTAGIEAFKAKRADFVITDLKMDGASGVEVLRTISGLDADVPIMIITGFGTVETAVEAMKLGAFDFLTKPIQTEVVRLKIERALELCAARRGRRKADAMTEYLAAEAAGRFPELVGSGERMAVVRRTVEKVAASDTTVFVAGESGTGKELVARAIHRLSKRANGPFIKVNCGALTETLLESELFGHEKGAFTGAIKQKLGRFELADGGTLFLDEVGDVPPADAGEAPARAAGAGVRARRRRGADQGRRPRGVGDQQGPREPRSRPGGSARTSTSGSTCCRSSCRRCASAARTSRSCARTSWPSSARRPTRACAPSATRRSAGSWRTTGPATCASSRTRSSRRWCSPRATRSRPAALPQFLQGGGEEDRLDVPRELSLPEILDDLERQLILKAYAKAGRVKTETARLLGIKTSALYYKLEKYGIE